MGNLIDLLKSSTLYLSTFFLISSSAKSLIANTNAKPIISLSGVQSTVLNYGKNAFDLSKNTIKLSDAMNSLDVARVVESPEPNNPTTSPQIYISNNYSSPFWYTRDSDFDGIADWNDPWPFTFGPFIDMNNNGFIDWQDVQIANPYSQYIYFENYYPQISIEFYFGSYYGFNSWSYSPWSYGLFDWHDNYRYHHHGNNHWWNNYNYNNHHNNQDNNNGRNQRGKNIHYGPRRHGLGGTTIPGNRGNNHRDGRNHNKNRHSSRVKPYQKPSAKFDLKKPRRQLPEDGVYYTRPKRNRAEKRTHMRSNKQVYPSKAQEKIKQNYHQKKVTTQPQDAKSVRERKQIEENRRRVQKQNEQQKRKEFNQQYQKSRIHQYNQRISRQNGQYTKPRINTREYHPRQEKNKRYTPKRAPQQRTYTPRRSTQQYYQRSSPMRRTYTPNKRYTPKRAPQQRTYTPRRSTQQHYQRSSPMRRTYTPNKIYTPNKSTHTSSPHRPIKR